MKRIFKFSLIVLLAAGFTACEDAYDIKQESELSEEVAFQTVDDLNSGLSGAYEAYNPDAGGDAVYFSAIFTDELKRGANNTGGGSETYSFLLNSLSGEPGQIWTSRYFCINRINRVLRNFDRVLANASAADIARANGYKGQLYALRALCHFDLYQFFTPELQNPNSPSAIIMDFVPDIKQVFPRNTAGEVVSFILSDLDLANGLLGTSSTAGSVYLTPDAVDFIRAKTLLYSNYSNSAQVEAIANELISNHPIADRTQYPLIWQDDLSITELIFTLFRAQGGGGAAGLFYANSTEAEGLAYLEMSFGLYDAFDPSDIRRDIFVDGTSEILFGGTTIFINKYPGSARGLLTNHFKAFRSSEMAFIKAEAQARQGNLPGARQTMIDFRVNRTDASTPAYTDLNAALRDILNERRLELCYEGHRYIDLKRIGREIGDNLVRDSRDCASFSAACTLSTTDYRFTLPIPSVEINPNPGIEQNPNY